MLIQQKKGRAYLLLRLSQSRVANRDRIRPHLVSVVRKYERDHLPEKERRNKLVHF